MRDTLSDAQQLIARELSSLKPPFAKSEESDAHTLLLATDSEPHLWSCHRGRALAFATVLGLGNTTVWQTSLAGRHRVEIHAEHNDYRITGTRSALF